MTEIVYWVGLILYGFGMFYFGYHAGKGDNAKSRVAETSDNDPRGKRSEGMYKKAPTRNNPERGQ